MDDAMLNLGSPRDPVVDLEALDDAPAKDERREHLSGVELTTLFVRESSTQLPALRGPIYIDELATDDVRPAVYYRRPSREDLVRIRKASGEVRAEAYEDGKEEVDPETLREDLYLMMFLHRALDENGKRLFAGSQLDEARAASWNIAAIRRVVDEMAEGSATQLTDTDLGNS